MQELYHPETVETEAQTYWEEEHSFEATEDLSKEKFYCLTMLPYPSGDLHMGHVRVYTIGDMIARYHLQNGKNVLQPMGWDAFGLPAENAAIQRDLPPAEWTEKNIKRMRKQMNQLGLGFDWSREISTCEPSYYRWEQWLFLQLLKKGLAYKKQAIVNWDPVDQTVLANEQVVNGRGWRSGALVERREISQWFLKISAYADELLNDLNTLKGWPEAVITMQRNWIGRSEGAEIHFALPADTLNNLKGEEFLTVYTTRPDTLMGVTYLAIALEHPLAHHAAQQSQDVQEFINTHRKTSVAEADIATQEKVGIFSGLFAIHPITQKQIPIWITNFVLMEYGSGAVMSVPAHDERDHELALKYNLPIIPVIHPPEQDAWNYTEKAYTAPGILSHAGPFTGLSSEEAIQETIRYLENNHLGKRQINYRLRDWGISRQRYWGTPIPVVYCKDCGTVPVPEKDLPVVLPTHLIPTGKASPLTTDEAFCHTTCPHCGKEAQRETDTMDTFVESSWYYARYCCPDQDQAMLDDRARYWTPVDQYVGGIEHAVMHLLYARFFHKVLRDVGLLNSDEPFTRLLTQGMVIKDGAKMSKSKGNVVAPQALIKKYGADTVRLFTIFAAPPESSLEWSDAGVDGAFRFLNKLWAFAHETASWMYNLNKQSTYCTQVSDDSLKKERQIIHQCLQQANHDFERQQFNTVVSAAMKIFNILTKLPQNTQAGQCLTQEGLKILLQLLAPITPHVCHVLWRELSFGEDILNSGWPLPNQRALITDEIEMVVQINGKRRATIQVPQTASHEQIENLALQDETISRHLEGHPIKKIIVVPKRLINIVV